MPRRGLPKLLPVRAQHTAAPNDTLEAERLRMVEAQIAARGIEDPEVLEAMREVPRHRFVPAEQADRAYLDHPLPIGQGQTISQPYIVAYMTEEADIEPGDRVLEIGTGSGYAAAVLGEIAEEVYSIEIVPELAERARTTLDELGYENVHVRTGNGYLGWPEQAPFDAILVTAAPPEIPHTLVEQLAVGGKMVVPVGEVFQEMMIIEKTPRGRDRAPHHPRALRADGGPAGAVTQCDVRRAKCEPAVVSPSPHVETDSRKDNLLPEHSGGCGEAAFRALSWWRRARGARCW